MAGPGIVGFPEESAKGNPTMSTWLTLDHDTPINNVSMFDSIFSIYLDLNFSHERHTTELFSDVVWIQQEDLVKRHLPSFQIMRTSRAGFHLLQ